LGTKKKIRVLDTGSLSASENMALDEAILESREEEKIPDTIRFLSFDPHCALVGYFQSVDGEIRTGFCKKESIEINRRITGGGAIYWGIRDIGWEIFASKESFSPGISVMEDFYRIFCTAASNGINKFGLKSSFRPRNDIEIKGRKVSGSGGTSIKKSFMFQGTLLVETNLDIMVRALRIPVEKLRYSEINSLKERITWLSRELGYLPAREDIIKNLLEGFSQSLELDYYFDELSAIEKKLFQKKIDYFRSSKHIYRVSEKKNIQIKSINKTAAGFIRCGASIDIKRKILKNVNFTGDFFIYPKRAVFDIESVLKNISICRNSPLRIINDFYKNCPYSIEGVTEENLALSVMKCIEKLELKKYKIPPRYFNDIFIVETSGNKTAKLITDKKIEVFLLPYCAKLPDCTYRFSEGCDICGKCGIGELTDLLKNHGIKSKTITSYENLENTLKTLKEDGVKFFGGCCCEAFYLKHKEDFEKIGLAGILLNTENRTCYDLGKEKDAHYGRFEGFTEIKLPLVKKIIKIFNSKKSENA